VARKGEKKKAMSPWAKKETNEGVVTMADMVDPTPCDERNVGGGEGEEEKENASI